MVWKLTAAVSLATVGVRSVRHARHRAYHRGYARGVTAGAAYAFAAHRAYRTAKGETEQ